MHISAKEISEVYKNDMLGVRGHAELTHYEERLEQVLGKEMLPLALDMLTQAAVTGHLTPQALAALQKEYTFEEQSFNDVQKEILWVLEHDGYLKPVPKGYAFVSRLLKNWWVNRYRLSFIPILKRGV